MDKPDKARKILFSNTTKITIISIVLVIAVSYGIFFYILNNTEMNVRKSLFEQQKARQIESTRALSRHIGSDLNLIISRLELVANSYTLQQGDLSEGNKTEDVTQKSFYRINSTAPLDGLLVLDKNNIVRFNVTAAKHIPKFVDANSNLSSMQWARETKDTLSPVFSNGYLGKDGTYRIIITFPIVNGNTGKYLGLVAASLPTVPLFRHYGNIYDIKSQYLVVLDRNTVQLIHPVKSFIGTSFFGNYTQQATGHNKVLNNIIRTVLSGKPYSGTYEFRNGERLNTGNPIVVGSRPEYYAFVVTPTSAIFSQIDNVIYIHTIEIFSLLAGVTIAVAVLVIFLIKWNSNLNKEIKKRTRELESANEQLKANDKMQKEFINIASHEMKTPTQAIIGYSELLQSDPDKSDEFIQAISRNAVKLQRLTSDLLDVARIESHALRLNKENFNIRDIIVHCINDLTVNNSKDVKLSYEPKDIVVEADKGRISQVIANLLGNALKFTEHGKICITTERNDNHMVVSVRDTGTGIGQDLFPRLFSKFVSKSSSGTGLGLFISKSIVEDHGGRVWAKNNTDGKGATFSFSLPLAIGNK
jgi:signal transduction histidine kinase